VASVTPDGKYLFFNINMNSGNYKNADIFWVDPNSLKQSGQNYKAYNYRSKSDAKRQRAFCGR
tara:strand:- start:850 stop:1038 length:189 start_codon:yes stop_codon:yes gene_type:complete